MKDSKRKFHDAVDALYDEHFTNATFSSILLTADTVSLVGGVHASVLNPIDAGILFQQLQAAKERLIAEYPHLATGSGVAVVE